MKTYLTYGLGITIAGAILVFIEYFAGFHNDIEKFKMGQIIGTVGGLTITIVGLVLAMIAARAQSTDGAFPYGRAFLAGFMTALFAGLFGAVFYLLYGFVINPEFHEVLYQYQMDQIAAKGVSASQAEGMEGMMRFFCGPVWFALMSVFGSLITGTLLSLIIAIFVKRNVAASAPPPLAAA
jgi:hypothetical protein